MDSSTAWNTMDPTLSVAPHDDFQQFLDMGIDNLGDSLQFDFPEFNGQQSQGGQLMQQDKGERMGSHMDGTMGHGTTMQEHIPAMTAQSHSTIQGSTSNGQPSSDSLVEIDAQIQYLQQQRQQQQMQEQQKYYTRNGLIPPTPNSMELHGNAGQFYSPLDHQRYRMQVKDQDMAFTPLASPAVTPLDVHFNIPEYTVPGAYFSPLSSPALHAQNEHVSIYDQLHSNTTNSPADLNLECHSAPSSSTILPKSGRKPPQKTRGARKIQQSPITKPRKGKKGSTTNIPTQALGDILEPENPQITRSKAIGSSHSTTSTESENGSISPEHLSHMAPPPIPAPTSAGRSPYARPQKNARTEQLALGSPATPASLMRLTQSPTANQQAASHDMDIDDMGIEAFALPEAANDTRPPTSRIGSDGQATPTLASYDSKTPSLQPLPTPAFTQPKGTTSATQSPQIDPINETNGSRKTPQMAPRGSKKRLGSSVLASPALLPRISPSIKPLLPGGGSTSDDTASLLLASKSNYQNILEGTHLPGVSYPTELSTNLTSKRTSHKIAEQGRRNRINYALQEIATLLPRGINSKDSGGEKSCSGDGDGETPESVAAKGATQNANSKASTVEHAIEYIKQLKRDLEDANRRADDAEKLLTKVEAKVDI